MTNLHPTKNYSSTDLTQNVSNYNNNNYQSVYRTEVTKSPNKEERHKLTLNEDKSHLFANSKAHRKVSSVSGNSPILNFLNIYGANDKKLESLELDIPKINQTKNYLKNIEII